MATSLDATVGGASANTYATRAEADTFHDNRPAVGTTWADATDDAKDEALWWAAKLMERLIVWTGWPVDSTQALQWPRNGMWKPTGFETVESTVVPQEVKDAQAEFARQLLVEDRAGDSDIETQGITHLKAGPVELDFEAAVSAKVVPDAVVYLIPDDWYTSVRGRSSMTRRLARV